MVKNRENFQKAEEENSSEVVDSPEILSPESLGQETVKSINEKTDKIIKTGESMVSSFDEEKKSVLQKIWRKIRGLQKRTTQEIEDLVGSQSIENQEVDENTLKRVERNIFAADLISSLDQNQKLEGHEKAMVRSMLERRNWSKMLNGINVGDRVVTIMTPAEDFLSIKNLNDNVFGPQMTDNIIAERRRATEEIFQKYLSEISDKDVRDLNLEQNFKFGVFKLPKDLADRIDMKQICQESNERIKLFILELVKHEIDSTEDRVKIIKLKQFQSQLEETGFNLDFGVASVKDEGVEDRILALANSMQVARLRGVNSEVNEEYKKSDFENHIQKIDEIKEKLIRETGNVIKGEKGDFQIFETGQKGRYVLNRDLMRDVRKGKFVPAEGQEDTLGEVQQYMKSLNVLDFVKYFTSEEVKGFDKKAQEVKSLSDQIKEGDLSNIERIKNKLKTNEKDERFTSNDLFHAESMKKDNCTYLSLDVLDLGVDQLLEYEGLLQDVRDGELSFEEATLRAGDVQTKKLQDIRTKAAEIIRGYKNGKLLNEDGLIVGLIGGDEFTFAVDNERISEEDLDQIIFDLKKSTNSRVIKTVIAESSRSSESVDLSNPDNQKSRLKEHLDSLRKAEIGAEKAKQLEDKIRKIKRFVSERFKGKEREQIKQMLDILEGLEKKYVVVEDGNEFKFKLKDPPQKFSLDEMKKFVLKSVDLKDGPEWAEFEANF